MIHREIGEISDLLVNTRHQSCNFLRQMSRIERRLPVGAELQPGGGAHFRVWCPDHADVAVVVERSSGGAIETKLGREPNGYASACVAGVKSGDRYRFRVGADLLADPASRSQPEGPFGPSEVIDSSVFVWTDHAWTGRPLHGAIVYELHCGTFTREGTWRAAMDQLPYLAELGVTVLEIMPVSEFPGGFGWGYDGVFPFAPTRLYGTPDDFRTFVDHAHQLRLAVILDVVYNHLGPDGCVLSKYSRAYFTDRYANEWGDAINFDGPSCEPVREYFIANAGYWIDEFHLDGLRLDATQTIYDGSSRHVIAEIAREVRTRARGRQTLLIAENEPQQTDIVRPIEAGGYGLDALWNDDFHHSAVVALTGRAEAYYSDHRGTPQELISAAKYGYLFQGQRYAWQKQPRGTSTRGLLPASFVNFIENHDQIANSGDGRRLHQRVAPGRLRAMTALLLLMPGTPMLFQGQEIASSAPFRYFADHHDQLAENVQKGRSEFLAQFPSLASAEAQAALPLPHQAAVFEACKIDWRERETHAHAYRLHRDLVRLRSDEPVFAGQAAAGVDGAVLGGEAFALRFFADVPRNERLLVVNLGSDIVAGSFAEPLVAPPERGTWIVQWSSEHPRYGGTGTPQVVSDSGWRLPGHAAIVLRPETTDGSNGATRR
jgi:maltooligosyltrehalose trehalohydrolase